MMMLRSTVLSVVPLAGIAACVSVSVESASQGEGAPGTGGPGSSGDSGLEGGGSATPPTGDAPTSGVGSGSSGGDSTTGSPTAADVGTGVDTSGSQEAVCGDGVVEGEEACDEGFEANQDQNACTTACQAARCGDGFVQASNGEACDEGLQNAAEPGYGQCSTGCLLGPHCGDGIVQPEGGEECEPSIQPADAGNCASMCSYAPRIVFLTSDSFTGDLGGLAGADKRCNEYAAGRNDLTGSFRAWLLVDGQSLGDRFPEFSDPDLEWNFTSMGNELLAKSFGQLVAAGPQSSLVFTESGGVMAQEGVWTNITSGGAAAGGDCGQWTSTAGANALVGHSGFDPDQGAEAAKWHAERQWTDLKGLKAPCTGSFHLYCVQVAG